MSLTAVVGALWGDEGKGKIIDAINEEADTVVKFQGGSNAGTTYVVGGKKYILHLLPSGVLRGKRCLLGPMIVMRPDSMCKELEDFNYDVNLGIDPRLHVTLPYHLALDFAREKFKSQARDNKKAAGAIGTTLSGIGPSYEQQRSRDGVRFHELVGNETLLKDKIRSNFEYVSTIIRHYLKQDVVLPERKVVNGDYVVEEKNLTLDYCYDIAIKSGQKLKRYLTDVSLEIFESLNRNKKVMAQGAQGTLLDITFGNYPKVTSSEPRASAVYSALGLPPVKMKVVGVVKAYPTKVGSGPVVTCLDKQQWPVNEKLSDKVAKIIRERGNEKGATTGRPRRVAWPDLVLLKYSQRLNGYTDLALTRLDILENIDPIKVAVAYSIDNKVTDNYPSWDMESLAKAEPVYVNIEGFGSLKDVKSYEDLPKGAKRYIELIEWATKTPVTIISVGAERERTIYRNFKPFF